MKPSRVTTTENPLLAAFSGLRRRLRPTLSRWLGEDEADDALQEAFCRLWPERERWADADEAARVLNVTARHIGIDELRRRQKLGETSLEEGCDPTDEADAEDEAAERYRRVKQIIDQRLTPLQREILERRETREEAFEDIAATLNMQPAAVRMQLSRARKLIREVYYEQSGIR